MRKRDFLTRIKQANKKAERIKNESIIECLRKLDDAKRLYDEAILLTLAEKARFEEKYFSKSPRP